MEQSLIRLNTSLTPHGQFGVHAMASAPNVDGSFASIGYDAVVCLEIYEPWIVEVFNSSAGLPSSMTIIDHAAFISDASDSDKKEVLKGSKITDTWVSRALNSTSIGTVYASLSLSVHFLFVQFLTIPCWLPTASQWRTRMG